MLLSVDELSHRVVVRVAGIQRNQVWVAGDPRKIVHDRIVVETSADPQVLVGPLDVLVRGEAIVVGHIQVAVKLIPSKAVLRGALDGLVVPDNVDAVELDVVVSIRALMLVHQTEYVTL
jgi:hypothetical protein